MGRIMNAETADSIRIADKHLEGASPEQRKALALDINEAIIRHAGALAEYAISQAFANACKRSNAPVMPREQIK